jgi:hypothetical protein
VTIYRLISRNTIEENILKKAREKRRLGELAIDEADFTPAFFKKTDNIRDLFYTNEDNGAVELGPIRLVGNEDEIKRAMENAEDQQDVMDAKELQAEIAIEEMEFEAPSMQLLDSAMNEDFVNVVNSLRPIERYAVHFIASQLSENEDL